MADMVGSKSNIVHIRYYAEASAINSTFSILYTAYRDKGSNGMNTHIFIQFYFLPFSTQFIGTFSLRIFFGAVLILCFFFHSHLFPICMWWIRKTTTSTNWNVCFQHHPAYLQTNTHSYDDWGGKNIYFHNDLDPCRDDEYDCEDSTCIKSSLKCNGRENCRFKWDETENCSVSII